MRQGEFKGIAYIRGMLAEGSWQGPGYPRPHLGVQVRKKQQHNQTTTKSKTLKEWKLSLSTKNNHEGVWSGIPDERLL
jgi:hypothetical protein